MSHDLTVKNLMNWISICESLLKRNKIKLFLKRLITGNDKWIMYDNNVRKRWSKQGEAPQTVAKPGSTPRKVILYDGKEIVHYELLPGLSLTCTVNNWKNYAKQSRKSDQNWSIGKASSSITTPDLTHLWWPVKYWETWLGSFDASTL